VADRQPAVERFRAALVDRVVPSLDWAMLPVTKVTDMVEDFQSYTRIYEQNQELRRELQQMKAWREAALAAGTEERAAAGPEPGAAGPALTM
jgi:rod shape-determining protein MreC